MAKSEPMYKAGIRPRVKQHIPAAKAVMKAVPANETAPIRETIMEAIHYIEVTTEVVPVHKAVVKATPAIETATEIVPVHEPIMEAVPCMVVTSEVIPVHKAILRAVPLLRWLQRLFLSLRPFQGHVPCLLLIESQK